ncbi:MAG: hypothetical protein JNL54_02070 [Kineosporiaceae bacterium]|nr:hypothetical protein [Kineosporiaceae bacterium]
MTAGRPVRDLTDPGQNRAVLELASRLLHEGDPGRRGPGGTTADEEQNPAVAVEADSAARARWALAAVDEPVHLSVVWAMYGETGRIQPRALHPHGEDFLREKVRQLDWLTTGLPVTWSILACDDGCPDSPSSAELMHRIARAEGYPEHGHRSVQVIRLGDRIGGRHPIGPAFDALRSPGQSRKGGSIVAALGAVLDEPQAPDGVRHVPCYTDADLSANLAQLGSLAATVVTRPGVVVACGQRYGTAEAVLVTPDGPTREPRSTGDKPDKLIILFRHVVRALLIPQLAHVADTQAGFKAFDETALRGVLPTMTSFAETFDVELLTRLAQRHGSESLAVSPIVFTEDFAATNFPSVDPGPTHLAMVRQVVELHDRLVAPVAPARDTAAELLELVRTLELDRYVRLIEGLRAEDTDDATLFDRRWPVSRLRALADAVG